MITQLAASLASVLAPLRAALGDPARLEILLAAAGWQTSEPIDDRAPAALAQALGLDADLGTVLALGQGEPTLFEAQDVVAAGGRVLGRLTELAEADPEHWEAILAEAVEALPAPFEDTATLLRALGDCGQALLAQWLAQDLPPLHAFLRAAGVIGGATPERVDWSALCRLFSEPGPLLTQTYAWGQPLSFPAIDAAIRALGDLLPNPLRVAEVEPDVRARYWNDEAPMPGHLRQYELPLLGAGLGEEPGDATEVTLVVVPVADGPGADPAPTGLLLAPRVQAGASAAIALGAHWSAALSAEAGLTGQAGLVLSPAPDGGVQVRPEAGAPAMAFELSLAAPEPTWTLGDAGGPRLELRGIRVVTGVRGGPDAPEPFLRLAAERGLALVIEPPASGGFLGFMLGEGLTVELDLDADLDAGGLRIGGGAGATAMVALDLSAGPLWLDRLDLGLAAEGDAIELYFRLDAELTLGPIACGLEGLGLAITGEVVAERDGALGGLDLRLTVTPPHTLWFVIDTPAVQGEGFLHLDGERYVGGLGLDVLAIDIDAFTIVDSVLPGGDEGFALFATLTLRFPSIPLGFGFSLSGLGGILAYNRGLDAEALALGLRNGAAGAVLFPEDPLRDAGTLVRQLDEYFPVLAGNTVVGPVAEISWGVGRIVTGQLGVGVALPAGAIVILGSIEAVLPDRKAPVLELHLDTLGAVDPDGGTLMVTASLYDARLLGVIELSGDAAVYLSWLNHPYFLLSVGGFHPGFEPPGCVPALFETLRPMRAEVLIGLGVKASLEAYFAVTSNTVQFGGGFEIKAEAEFLSVTYTARGWFEFDVLFRLTPFLMMTDASAGVGVYANDKVLMGVQLAVHLEGPEPWYASGRARFKFFAVTVRFDFAVGGHAPPALAGRIDVLELVRIELGNPAAWSIRRGSGVTAGIRFAGEGDCAHLRPDDRLEARQTVAPLDRHLARFGESTPEQSEVRIVATTLADAVTGEAIGGGEVTDALDWFAPAQYQVMPDGARLAAPSYEQMIAGVEIGAAGAGVPEGERVAAPEGHETEVWEPDRGRPRRLGIIKAARNRADVVAASAAGRRAAAARGAAVSLSRVSLGGARYLAVDPLTGATASVGQHYAGAVAAAAAAGARVVPMHAGRTT